MPLTIGSRFQHYDVIKQLGRGGFGIAYLVEDINLSVPRVIKELNFLSKNIQDDVRTDITKRFVREAKIMANLSIQSPNIVVVHALLIPDAKTTFKDYFIVMEYMDGGSLKDVLEKMPGERVNYREAVRITLEVCKGLRIAHEQGVIHRDIKPENILLSNDMRQVKVTDWGIAHFPDSTVTTGLIGTYRYMSPEQKMQSKVLDTRADLYTVGIVLNQMLTGQIVMLNQGEVLHKPSEFYAEIPPILDEIVLKLTEWYPQNRIQTAEKVIKALEEAIPDKDKEMEAAIKKAQSFYEQYQYIDALDCLEKAKNLDPKVIQIYLKIAAIYNRQGKHTDAIRILQQGEKIEPDNSDLLFDLGITYANNHQIDKAVAALNKCQRIDPKRKEVSTLIKKYRQGGQA